MQSLEISKFRVIKVASFKILFPTAWGLRTFWQSVKDVNVTCGGKEISVQISPLYVRRNSKWLRDGTFLRNQIAKTLRQTRLKLIPSL